MKYGFSLAVLATLLVAVGFAFARGEGPGEKRKHSMRHMHCPMMSGGSGDARPNEQWRAPGG